MRQPRTQNIYVRIAKYIFVMTAYEDYGGEGATINIGERRFL